MLLFLEDKLFFRVLLVMLIGGSLMGATASPEMAEIVKKVTHLQKSMGAIPYFNGMPSDHFKNYSWPGWGRVMGKVSDDFDKNATQDRPENALTLYVLVSFSMPTVALKTLAEELKRIGRVITFRGFYHNDLHLTDLKLRELGIAAEVDPVIFRKFSVVQVPCFIVVRHEGPDQIQEIAQVEGLVDTHTALEFILRNKKSQVGIPGIHKILRDLEYEN